MHLALIAFLLAAQGGPASHGVPPPIEEFVGITDFRAVRAAPDGRSIAFVARTPDVAANVNRTALYVWDPEGGPRKVTDGFESLHSPRWSPGSGWLAFIGSRPDTAGHSVAQVWALPMLVPGYPVQVTELERGVMDYGWADRQHIYSLAREADDAGVRTLWRVEVPGGDSEAVWGGDGVLDIAVSPNGRAIAFTREDRRSGESDVYRQIWILDLEDLQARRLTQRPGDQWAPIWAPSGSKLVFRALGDPGRPGSQTELFEILVDGSGLRMLTEVFDRAVIEHAWPRGGSLLFTAALGMHTHIFSRDPSGAIEQITRGRSGYRSLHAGAPGSTIFAIRDSGVEPPEIWRIGSEESAPITSLNRSAERWELSRQEVIQWRAPDGLNIEGLLVYPFGYRPDRRYPLLVYVHTGRADRVREGLLEPQAHPLFAAHGYAVLAPNFRGSIGYGEVFATAASGALAGTDLHDIMAGIDRVVEMGLADPGRLGVYGPEHGPTADSTGHPARELAQALRDRGRPAHPVEYAPARGTEQEPQERVDLFLRQLRRFDRHVKLDGSAGYAFYRVDESAPGPSGWTLRVVRATPTFGYGTEAAVESRYLELALSLEPEPQAMAERRIRALELDLASDIVLRSHAGANRSPAGTVTEATAGSRTLARDGLGTVRVTAPADAAPAALTVTLAFEIPLEASAYYLEAAGFAPVRLWIPGAPDTTGSEAAGGTP